MSRALAQSILEQGVLGRVTPPSSTDPKDPQLPTTTLKVGRTPVVNRGVTETPKVSYMPSSVLRENGITTYTLPDGTEFRLDDYGNPVISERSLTSSQKSNVRGGTFSDTQEEVDHIIPIALGGTDAPGNIRAAKSKKTISQAVWDFITKKKRLPGEYKPKNRQEGKMIVEWRAIDKYRAGEITLFEAMAAVQHYDDKELVNDFLKEDFYDLERKKQKQEAAKTLAKEAATAIPGLLAGGIAHIIGTKAGEKAADFVAQELKKSRRQGIINDMVGFLGGKRYVDPEDGKAMIFKVGEGLDAHQAIIAEETVKKNIEAQRQAPPTPFIYETPRRQALLTATAPIRFTAGSLARFLVNTGLELTGSDARFSPQTELQEFTMGKGDFIRLSQADDIYGATENFVQNKLEEHGIAHDKAHAAAIGSAILLGGIMENPFFSLEKAPAKEALGRVAKEALERELGGELSDIGYARLAKEAERIVNIKDPVRKQEVFKEFIESAKAQPDLFKKSEDELASVTLEDLRRDRKVLKEDQQRLIESTIAGDEQFLLESEARYAKSAAAEELKTAIPEFDDLSSAIKNSKIYRTQGSLDDTLNEALIMRSQGGRLAAVPAEDVNAYAKRGYRTIDSVDAIATRNNFENSEDLLAQVQKIDQAIEETKVGSANSVAHEYLLKNNPEYARLEQEVIATEQKLSKFEDPTTPDFLRSSSSGDLSRKSSAESLPTPKVPEAAQEQGVTVRPQTLPDRPTLSSKVPSYDKTLYQVDDSVKRKVGALDYARTPDRVLKKIGLEDEAKMLRKGYEAYLKELPQSIDKITAWSKRVAPEANQRIFQYLDGQDIKLEGIELEVANEIKAWLSEWAERLGLPKDRRIASYITHIFDDNFIQKEFDADLAKIITNKIPGSVYDPFLEKRLGKLGYKENTWAALDAYVKRATRKVNMDPALDAIRKRAGNTLEESPLEKSQFEYLKKYIDRVNMRPADLDSLIDNSVKSVIGYRFGQRPVTRIAKFLRQMTYRGMLGLNPASALRNLSQGINTYAILGEKYTALGYAKLFNKGSIQELKEVGVLADNFIQDRALSSTKKAIEKVDKVLFSFFETAEKINRGAAYFGAKTKALAKGKSLEEAIDYAKEIVRKTQFNFGSIDTPQALQSDIVKTLTQFQTYSIKQIEFLSELVQDKNFIGLARYVGAGIAFVATVGQAFDMDYKDLIPSFRFQTPPSLKLPIEVAKAALNAPDKYGHARSLKEKLTDIAQSALGLIPGSGQAKKTIGGLQAIKGQSNIPLTKKIQAFVFGKYAAGLDTQSLEEATSKEVTTEANRLMSLPKDQAASEFDAYVLEHPEQQDHLTKEIRDLQLGITEGEKEIRSLGVANGERAEAVVKELNKLETKEEKAALWDDYVTKKILTDEVQEQVKELLGLE